MSPSRPFILRPVATSLLMVGLLLAGFVAYKQLPVSALPQVDYPTIQVLTFYPGAGPDVMTSSVTSPLERQFGQIPGLNQMTSTSSFGSSIITLQFVLNLNIDVAEQEVQAAINAASNLLPRDLPNPPIYSKINPADAPILTLALTSSTLPLSKVEDVADTTLAQKISQLTGVGLVSISGGQRPAVRIQANPTALAAHGLSLSVGGSSRPAVRVQVNPTELSSYGISLETVRAVLSAANANRPKGELTDVERAWGVSATDQLFRAREYRPLIVTWHHGAPVRLLDIGNVLDSVEDVRNAGLSNGKPAVVLVIFRQPGANMIETVDRVYSILPQLRASISPSINLNVILDRTTTIRASIRDVEITLLISIALVVLVVFAFLRNPWATAIPSVAVPLSLVGTFGVMYLLGYSLDNLSLMALTISTGFVVDDAIVVIENISRHLESGMKPFAAAFLGAREIGFTVLSMSTSLIAVFIPILLMGGIVGRLFREFAVTLSIAIVVSLAVSLTTTPMMCARFLRQDDGRHGAAYRFAENTFKGLVRGYDVCLRWVLRHQPLVLGITILTICVNVYLFVIVPKGFFPQQDTGRIVGTIQADQDISFSSIRQKMEAFAKIVQEDPAVDTVTAFNGGGGGSNTARMFLQLKPIGVRKISADRVIARLRGKLAHIPGASLFMQAVQDVNVGGRFTGAQYQYTIQADHLTDLNQWAPLLMERMKKIPELRDVNSDQQIHGLQASLVVDRDTASRLGISYLAIDDTLNDAFGQRQVSNIYKGLNQYHVVLEVLPEYHQNPDGLKNIYVASNTGNLIPLSAFARFALTNTALTVNHQGQFPSITISFNLAPGTSLGNAVSHIQAAEHEIGLPANVHANFQGTAQAFQDSLASEPLLILTALAAVYIVLGILYESYIHPITILSTLPSAGVGALLAILLFRTDLNVIALIGIILLIGIVKKNAILMIDFAVQAERMEGKPPLEAIYEACLLRFRPIMMTTMAALLGALPLALGGGTGSELRRPLGITIVGGLILSQMLTLFTTPVVYLYLDRLQTWIQHFGVAGVESPVRD